jgi:molybdenum cofactor cytidylyltransferase
MRLALIPAAGHSRRMGRPKLALPVAGRTVLEHVLAALREAGVEHTLVVLGPHVSELAPVAEAGGAKVLILAEATPDMRATVEQGLAWLEQNLRLHPDDDWLLVPADHPTLRAEVMRRLAEARLTCPGHSIFVPTHAGRRGHPTLLAWKHVAGIRALPRGAGLNAHIRACAGETLEVAVDDPTILWDLDTPADYERLLQAGAAESSG